MEKRSASLKKLSTGITVIISVLALLLSIVSFIADIYQLRETIYIGVILLTLVYSVLIIYILNKKGKPRKIVILGPTMSGKTVYLLAVIHNVLMDKVGKVYNAILSDKQNILKWQEQVWGLYKGEFLPPATPPYDFGESAKFTLEKGGFPISQKIDLEIVDYAGELTMMYENNPYNIDLGGVNGIIFFIDATDIIDNKKHVLYLSTLSTLAILTSGPNQKSRIPIALVISKADLLSEWETPESLIRQKMPDIEMLCVGRFQSYKFFFVSSLGKAPVNGKLVGEIESFGVEEPILWLFDKVI